MNEKSLSRFFVKPTEIADKTIFLANENYHKVTHVLRLKAGDKIIISDNLYKEYLCSIKSMEKNKIICEILNITKHKPTDLKLIIAQAVIKKTGMEFLIQKATELGITELYPLITQRTIVHSLREKAERWHFIAESASLQSERQVIPIIHPIQSLEQFCSDLPKVDLYILCSERETVSIKNVLKQASSFSSVIILCGPEGGFTELEKNMILNSGFKSVSLGKNILRAETAEIVAISIIKYENNI